MILNPAAQPGRHALRDRKDDLYETPPEAVRALLMRHLLPPRIWEPACGRGAIAEVLRQHGHEVLATDLVDYGYQHGEARIDFLLERRAPPVGAIVTNPPFKLAAEFVEHALKLCPLVIMLLRLAFLESDRRSAILDGGQLKHVHVFRNRLPMMHRDGWEGPRATSTTAFAWFVWDTRYSGPAMIDRISWGSNKEWRAMWARPLPLTNAERREG